MDDILIKTNKLSLLTNKKQTPHITGCAVFFGLKNDVFLVFFHFFST